MTGRWTDFWGAILSRRNLMSSALASLVLKDARPVLAATPEDVRIAQIGVPVDIQDIAPDSWRHFELEGSPVFVRRLTEAQISARPKSESGDGSREENAWVVVSGICTHEGCRVAAGLGTHNGFACFCHGSEYDVYGRVRRGPAMQDLPVPPHTLRNGKLILTAGKTG
jgi:ubiquinol-cytochrome c reductase iron-sulfur subunit